MELVSSDRIREAQRWVLSACTNFAAQDQVTSQSRRQIEEWYMRTDQTSFYFSKYQFTFSANGNEKKMILGCHGFVHC